MVLVRGEEGKEEEGSRGEESKAGLKGVKEAEGRGWERRREDDGLGEWRLGGPSGYGLVIVDKIEAYCISLIGYRIRSL